MDERQIMDESGISRSLSRIAHEILERNRGVADVLLVGIHTRGVFLARRLAANLAAFEGAEVPVASTGHQPLPGRPAGAGPTASAAHGNALQHRRKEGCPGRRRALHGPHGEGRLWTR